MELKPIKVNLEKTFLNQGLPNEYGVKQFEAIELLNKQQYERIYNEKIQQRKVVAQTVTTSLEQEPEVSVSSSRRNRM